MAATAEAVSFEDCIAYSLAKLGVPELKLKREQLAAIRAVHDGKDCFVWLPTGFGKSLCFQALPFVFDYSLGLVNTNKKSMVVVAAPLVALIVDQVVSLRQKGVDAVVISSGGRLDKMPKDLLASSSSLQNAVLCLLLQKH